MAIRATFTLDPATMERLRRTAERLGKPKNAVLREAIHDHASRSAPPRARRDGPAY